MSTAQYGDNLRAGKSAESLAQNVGSVNVWTIFQPEEHFTQSDGRGFQIVQWGTTAGQNTREKESTTKRTLIREITRISSVISRIEFTA